MTKYQKQLLAGALALLVAFGVTLFAGDNEQDQRDSVERACAAGLKELADFGGLTLCTHGPDPAGAVGPPKSDVARFERVRSSAPCGANDGPRIHAFRDPALNWTSAEVRDALGYAVGQMRASASAANAQSYRILCNSKDRPVTTAISPVWGVSTAFSDVVTAFRNGGYTNPDRIYVFYGKPPGYVYAGQGTVGPSATSPQYALISAGGSDTGYGRVTVHEIGHNLGAVKHDAPHASGAYHCWEEGDVMCYNDGGSYFANGDTMVNTSCPVLPLADWVFDCSDDDYYNPGFGTINPALYNTATSEFLYAPGLWP